MLIRASYLTGLTILSFAGLFLYALIQLTYLDRGLRQEVDESTLWSISQATLEGQRLILALEQVGRQASSGQPADMGTVRLRYEILLSRLGLMQAAKQYEYFSQFQGPNEPYFAKIRKEIEALEPVIFAERLSDRQLQQALDMATVLGGDLHQLNTATALEQRSTRFDRRIQERQVMQMLIFAVAGVFATGVIMAALLWRNMRRLQRAKNELEHHRRSLEARVVERTQDLMAALEVEQRAKAAYQSFVVTVSHQFRTPISIIHMIAQRQLRNDTLSPPDVLKKKFANILEATDRLEQLVSGFLDHASIETIDQPLQLRVVDLEKSLQSAVTEARRLFPDREIETAFAPSDLVIEGDAALLEKAVLNLLSNALKYSDSTSVVKIQRWDVGLTTYIRVCDSGWGIPRESQGAIFDRFYRAPNVHRLPGVGVGLSRVRDIIMQHDGEVHFRSQEGAGSEFTLVLPAKGTKLNDTRSSTGDDSLH